GGGCGSWLASPLGSLGTFDAARSTEWTAGHSQGGSAALDLASAAPGPAAALLRVRLLRYAGAPTCWEGAPAAPSRRRRRVAGG
ncbi:MAG TPA: hypothetical protein VFT98_13255, partial [Myxococcota bacterium]|nr:hypothetical protein [Myxococcota bacterium]